ncbi:MAG: helix-turn-helix transcriptional regulator [Acutalibacteraceae bacterium]|nr:helix-turn-helix transcriptional regulator [Acutalibacteraceae bacterium]
MSINNIGTNISILRKQKGITQDELAKFVGVSAQAVSKWENGGIPDTVLLPKIADYFEVSIDKLFGRDVTQYTDAYTAFIKKIINAPESERFKVAFEYCWDIERAITSNDFDDCNIEECVARLGKSEERYSSMLLDQGFTRMGIGNRMQYFLLVPEIVDKKSALFDSIDYTKLFNFLADKDIFSALVFLNKRESDKAFTPKLLEKHLNITEEKSMSIIGILKQYNLISSTFIEIDDSVEEFFSFLPTPSFVALLIFAREIIDKPRNFSYHYECRKKPYLT